MPQSEQTRLAELADEIDRLRADVADVADAIEAAIDGLRTELAGEVRTRRVVVTEADGFERVVLEARGGYGCVTVVARTADPATTGAELFANDPIDGDGPHVGVALTNVGDVVGALEVLPPARPMLWLADDAQPEDVEG